MASLKKRRQSRYDYLISRHLAPIEAREFSKLSRKYPAIKRMLRQRAGMWMAFSNKARSKGWEGDVKQKEWVNTLKKFYRARNWVAHRDIHGKRTSPMPSPWEWYDAVYKNLPDELKWDTPRTGRHKMDQGEVKMEKIQKQKHNQEWIAGLRETARRDPSRRAEMEKQARRLGGRL